MFILNFKAIKDHNKRETIKQQQTEKKSFKFQQKVNVEKKDMIILKRLRNEKNIQQKKPMEIEISRVLMCEQVKLNKTEKQYEVTRFGHSISNSMGTNMRNDHFSVNSSLNFDNKDPSGTNMRNDHISVNSSVNFDNKDPSIYKKNKIYESNYR